MQSFEYEATASDENIVFCNVPTSPRVSHTIFHDKCMESCTLHANSGRNGYLLFFFIISPTRL